MNLINRRLAHEHIQRNIKTKHTEKVYEKENMKTNLIDCALFYSAGRYYRFWH